jgi:hypothetical protein
MYVTALFDPNLLDFERGWILCIVALWNTFGPACNRALQVSWGVLTRDLWVIADKLREQRKIPEQKQSENNMQKESFKL